MGSLLLAWAAEIGIITYRDLTGSPAWKAQHTVASLPLPADYIATVLIFGSLGLAGKSSQGAKTAANLFGWAVVIATFLNVMPGVPKTNSTSTSTTTAAAKTAPKTGAVA